MSLDHLNIKKWTISLLETKIDDKYLDLSDEQAQNPIWNFIPITCIIIPVLHMMLGLANDILANFWDWVDERVEVLTTYEIEAQNMVLLAQIAVEDNNKVVVDAKNVIEDISLRRIDINEELKVGKDVLTQEEINGLKEEKEESKGSILLLQIDLKEELYRSKVSI